MRMEQDHCLGNGNDPPLTKPRNKYVRALGWVMPRGIIPGGRSRWIPRSAYGTSGKQKRGRGGEDAGECRVMPKKLEIDAARGSVLETCKKTAIDTYSGRVAVVPRQGASSHKRSTNTETSGK